MVQMLQGAATTIVIRTLASLELRWWVITHTLVVTRVFLFHREEWKMISLEETLLLKVT